MELIKCECCGANSLQRHGGNILKCEFCGSTYQLDNNQQIINKELTDARVMSLWDKAEKCRIAKNYAEEAQILAQALELDGNNAISWGKIGLAYKHLSWYDKALECFNKAISIDPNRPVTYSNISTVYYDKGDMQSAIMYIEKALSIMSKDDSDYPTLLANYGIAVGKTGDLERAAAILNDAEKAGYTDCYSARNMIGLGDPNDPLPYSDKGVDCTVAGDYRSAIAYFEKALSLVTSPSYEKYGLILANYSVALGKLGDKKRAEAVLKKAEKAGYPKCDQIRQLLGLKIRRKFFS